jgi:hypothetical protein
MQMREKMLQSIGDFRPEERGSRQRMGFRSIYREI